MIPVARNSPGTVLVVEDDDDLRGALADILLEEGYDVVDAAHGAAALDLLRGSRDFCAILLDMRMPIMGGVEFRRAQLRDPRLSSIPVVLFSADARDREEAERLGTAGSLSKPVDILQLLEAVAALCGDPDRMDLASERKTARG
ncbi:MAG: response regulator [Acidobacteriota bacterium]